MSENTLEKIDLKKPVGSNLNGFRAYLKKLEPSIANVVAGGLKPERIAKIVVNCVSKTPALRDCSMETIVRSMMQAAELGFEPGGATGEAYLVPYKNQCQLILGYRGLLTLAYRSGRVLSAKPMVVYEGDLFEYEEGFHPKLRHIPDFKGNRDASKITHAYVVVELAGGGRVYDVMTRQEIENVRQGSPSKNATPWTNHWAEMARKTVVRRCLKYVPMSVEMQKAFALEAREYGEDSTLTQSDPDANFDFFEAVYEEEPTKTDKLKERLGATVDPATGEVMEEAGKDKALFGDQTQ